VPALPPGRWFELRSGAVFDTSAQGRTVTIDIGYSAGGGYDPYGKGVTNKPTRKP